MLIANIHCMDYLQTVCRYTGSFDNFQVPNIGLSKIKPGGRFSLKYVILISTILLAKLCTYVDTPGTKSR